MWDRALLEHVPELGIGDVAEGGQLGAWPHRPDDPTRRIRPAPAVRDLTGELCRPERQVVDAVLDAVLSKIGQVGAEGVGLDGIAPGLEIGVVNASHDVGPSGVEDLVAALESLEIVERQVGGLEHRAHRAVRDDHPLAQGREQSVVCDRCSHDQYDESTGGEWREPSR